MTNSIFQTFYAIVVAVAMTPPADEPAALAKQEANALPTPVSTEANKQTSPTVRPSNPRVLFITTKDCPRCDQELAKLRRPGGDFDRMRSHGWKIGETADSHLQIVDRESVADLVEKLSVLEFPTVACVEKNQVVRSFKSGCTTPLDMWTFGWLAKGVDERPPAAVMESAQVESTGSYRLRGNHWSIDEDWNPTRERVISHLRGPAHGGSILASQQIETWSYEELRSLHDDLHERELAANGGYSRGRESSQHGFNPGTNRKISGKY